MISVYITSYNKENYLGQAIESVLAQSLQSQDIVIVDDASSDSSRDIIGAYKSRYPHRINTIFNEQNLGISKTRNIALEQCKGDIVTFLDGDDMFYPNKLLSEYEVLSSQKHLSVVYSNFAYINPSDEKVGIFSENNDEPATGDILIETLLRHYHISSGNNYIYEMYYKNCALEIGNYDEDILLWEDWDFRIRMSTKYHYGYCQNVNSAYRKLNNGLHNSSPELHYREQIKIYKKNKHLILNLNKEVRELIHNRLYSQLKNLFIKISHVSLKEKKYISFLIDSIQFLFIFKMKKTLRFIISELS
ncbi:MAG: glycosyltransferase family 2 protein [Candidatus Marinimicrobia bacterium]|nr:glycosyltransferase family 2 protein [Candidatus Neomarinimicrobiota bacterium]